MKPATKETDEGCKPGVARGEGSESLLRAEIAFWRELLSDCDHSVPAESIERMRQALALAEQRFLQLCRDRQAGTALRSGALRTCVTDGKVLH